MAVPLILGQLAGAGLTLLVDALVKVGKDVVEKKTGIKLPDLNGPALTDAQLFELKKAEIEHQAKLLELALEEKKIDASLVIEEGKAVTDRWRFDMSSDSWLSKNVRPVVLVSLVGYVMAAGIASAFDIKIDDGYIELFGELLGIVFVAYYGSRGLEKIASVIAGRRK